MRWLLNENFFFAKNCLSHDNGTLSCVSSPFSALARNKWKLRAEKIDTMVLCLFILGCIANYSTVLKLLDTAVIWIYLVQLMRIWSLKRRASSSFSFCIQNTLFHFRNTNTNLISYLYANVVRMAWKREKNFNEKKKNPSNMIREFFFKALQSSSKQKHFSVQFNCIGTCECFCKSSKCIHFNVLRNKKNFTTHKNIHDWERQQRQQKQ